MRVRARGLHLKLARDERCRARCRILIVSNAGDVATMSHQRHRIELGENAEATVLFQFVGSGASRLATQLIDVALARGARLSLYRLQKEGAGASLITRIDARLRATASSGADRRHRDGLARHDFDVDLAEAAPSGSVRPLHAAARRARRQPTRRRSSRAALPQPLALPRSSTSARAPFSTARSCQTGAQKTTPRAHRESPAVAACRSQRKTRTGNLCRRREMRARRQPSASSTKPASLFAAAAIARRRPRFAARAFATEILDRIQWPALRTRIESTLNLPTEMTSTSRTTCDGWLATGTG